MLTARIKAALAAAAVLLLVGLGWTVRGWYEGARDAAALEAEARAYQLMDELARQVSTRTEAAIGAIRIENRTIHQKATKEVIREQVYRDCTVPDTGRVLLNQARRPAAGQPDPAVPGPGTD